MNLGIAAFKNENCVTVLVIEVDHRPMSPSLFVAEDFLSVDDKALVAEPLTDQVIIESVAAPAANELDEDEGDDAEVTESPPPTISDTLGALSTLRWFIETRTCKDGELSLQYICALSDMVDDARLTQLRKTSIFDFFGQ